MKRSAFVLALIALTGMGNARAFESSSHWAAPDDPTARAIIAVERAWNQATCGIPPPPMLRAAVANDFQGTSTTGQRYGKSKALETGDDRKCALGPVRIRFFGDSLAIAVGSESSVGKTRNGAETRRCQVWTDTWLKRSGKWQVIAAQDNPVACR